MDGKTTRDLRCHGVTFISGSVEEYGSDGWPDWSYRVRAQCDGTGSEDCGFNLPVPDEDGEAAWGVTNVTMAELHAKHLAHSRDGRGAA